MANAIVPPKRPGWSREKVLSWLHGRGAAGRPALLGVRGYYRDSMGQPGVNDRGIYDDAIYLLSPTAFVAFNANVDPSVTRPKIATLLNGSWEYKVGTHGLSKPKAQRYTALVQAAPVTVQRDGGATESGYFGINIHRGGRRSTSSEGCQTIWPDQWDAFIALVKAELKRYNEKIIPYVLVEAQG